MQLAQQGETSMSNDESYQKMLRKFIIPILRKKSLYWPARNEALKLARVERGFYKCQNCGKLFSRKEVHVDHIKSVIDTKEAWQSWDVYISRLFVPVEELQVLCIRDHESKTLLENNLRQINRKKKKKKS